MKDKLIVFQSDFGIQEGTVSQMHGISVKVDPALRIFDLTHLIPKFNTWEASYSLYQTCHAWPEETVFVSVIDPGVGSGRKSVVAKTSAGHYIVTPDNGTLTHLKKHIGIKAVREIDESVNRVKGSEKSHVFHGRDVYAYTGARLASGAIDFAGVGPEFAVDEIVMHEIIDPLIDGNQASGVLDIEDPHFGMVWTNIPIAFFATMGIAFGDKVRTVIAQDGEAKYSEVLPYCRTFSDVPKGDELVYNNEIGNLAVATNLGNFVEKFGVKTGNHWKISFEKL
ncbi:MAG: S-adenosyl-l-methionine hydroxide adenosyltransferase family protein [Chloroflexota bacterium]